MRHLVLLFFLLFLACEEEQHPLMVDDDKALALLVDLNIANVALTKYPTGLRDSLSLEYRKQICGMHNLEEAELDTVLWMMQSDFDRYNKLYKDLRDTLAKIEDKLGEVDDGERLKYDDIKDSLKAESLKLKNR